MARLSRSLIYFINILLYFTALATWLSIPDSHRLNLGVSAGAIALTMAILWVRRRELEKYYKSIYFKNLVSTMISSLLIFCLVALVNYLIFKNNFQWDLTRNLTNSLSSQTKEILKKVPGSLKFTIFIRKSETPQVLPLLDLYRMLRGDIQLEVVDPDLNPSKVRQYRVQHYGVIIAELGEQRAEILDYNEASITQGILKLLHKRDFNILLATGHGGVNLEDTSALGGSALQKLLQESLYKVQKTNLATLSTIPAQTDVVLLLGVENNFLPQEIVLLRQYVQGGGRILVALDAEFNGQKENKLRELIKEWGIIINNDLVIDTKDYISGSEYKIPLVSHYDKEHPVTRHFTGQTFFPPAASLQKSDVPREDLVDLEIISLAQTNPLPFSWAEKNVGEIINDEVHYNDGIDSQGPVNLVLAAKFKTQAELPESKMAKVVAIGNSSFIANRYAQYSNNFNFFLNMLSWLSEEDFTIAPERALTPERPVMMSTHQVGIIFYFSIVFVPLLLLGFSIYIYKKR